MRRCTAAVLAAIVLAAPPPAAGGQQTPVDLELVIAVDVSFSMDADEQRLQRAGYVAAFRHAEVIGAIEAGPLGRIAVTYLEWAGAGNHRVLAPWTLIADAGDGEAFAARLAEAPPSREGGTSLSSALLQATGRFADNGFAGARQAIDLSGDGPNNSGHPVTLIRDWVVRQGIVINGLPIMLKQNFSYGEFGLADLDLYYEDCVIGGPGAFVVAVGDAAGFEAAIRRKLVLEIAAAPAPLLPVLVATASPRVDCLVGEKARRAWTARER
jgi:hypothetical protein